jgi:5'-phosphate synthase pdxT subunit
MSRIGVLALQGGAAPHARALRALGHEPVEVRVPGDLRGLAGLVLPGGESTAQLKLMERVALRPALEAFAAERRPVLATCAGLILAANRVTGPAQPSLGWLDVDVRRNAYGRQLESFEATSDRGQPLVFIRAPRITAVGRGVETLDTLDGEPIVVRGGNVVGACYHPELTSSLDVHRAVFGAA